MKLSRKQLLKRTRALLLRGGWCQGDMGSLWLDGPHCLLGAACAVLADADDPRAVAAWSFNDSDRIAKALGFRSTEAAWRFNDSVRRTKEDVLNHITDQLENLS